MKKSQEEATGYPDSFRNYPLDSKKEGSGMVKKKVKK